MVGHVKPKTKKTKNKISSDRQASLRDAGDQYSRLDFEEAKTCQRYLLAQV